MDQWGGSNAAKRETMAIKRKRYDAYEDIPSYEKLIAQGKSLRSTANRIPNQESLYTCRVYYLNQALDAFQRALNSSTYVTTEQTQECLEQIRETQIDRMVLSKVNATHQLKPGGPLRITVRNRPLLPNHLPLSDISSSHATKRLPVEENYTNMEANSDGSKRLRDLYDPKLYPPMQDASYLSPNHSFSISPNNASDRYSPPHVSFYLPRPPSIAPRVSPTVRPPFKSPDTSMDPLIPIDGADNTELSVAQTLMSFGQAKC